MTSTPETGNPMMAGVMSCRLLGTRGYSSCEPCCAYAGSRNGAWSCTARPRSAVHAPLHRRGGVAAGVMAQLAADDTIVATYREHGHALPARTADAGSDG